MVINEKKENEQRNFQNIITILQKKGVFPEMDSNTRKVNAMRWVKRSMPGLKLFKVSNNAVLVDLADFEEQFEAHLERVRKTKDAQAEVLAKNVKAYRNTPQYKQKKEKTLATKKINEKINSGEEATTQGAEIIIIEKHLGRPKNKQKNDAKQNKSKENTKKT